MESSGPSANAPEPPSYRWAAIFGTAIAVLTITFPTLVIANYSSPRPMETLPRTTYVPNAPSN